MWGEPFLRRPATEIAAQSMPGGSEAIVVDIATGPVRIAGLDRSQRDHLRHRYGPFVCPDDGAGRPTLKLRRAPAEAFAVIDMRGWEYTLALGSGDGRLRAAGPGFLFEGAPEGELALMLGLADEIEAAVDNSLRLWLAHRAFARGGLLLHSAGIVIGEQCVLCVGRSGAGKSTLCRQVLADGGRILSDELNVLMSIEGRVYSQLLPFTGDVARDPTIPATSRFPVAALVRLEQGDRHRVAPESHARLTATLMAAAPFVNADRHAIGALGERCLSLLNQTQSGQLIAALGPGALDAVSRWLSEDG